MAAKPRLLVTGASGFLGRAFLAAHGDRFECVAMSRGPARGDADGRIAWIEHDLRQPLTKAGLPKRVDLVLHLASARDPGSGADIGELYTINVAATAALADYAAHAGARRFVYGSTGGVYGYRPGRIRESAVPRPFDAYTLSKWHGEEAARFHAGCPVGIVRYFFPYGPGQRTGIVPRLTAAIAAGSPIVLHARGRYPTLNPVYVSDAVELTRRVLASRRPLIVNCAGPDSTRMPRLTKEIARLLDVTVRYEPGDDPRVGDMVGDMSLAARELRFRPRVGLDAGLVAAIGS
jgi:UDP-glucose 4-epimerase